MTIHNRFSLFLVLLIISAKSGILAEDNNKKLFITLATGVSFSNKANIKVDSRAWDPAPEGYNACLGNSEFYTAGLGYKFSDLIRASLEATRRPSFNYKKFQSPSSGTNIGFIGTKNRLFKLENTSIMGNIYFYSSGLCDKKLAIQIEDCLLIQPFVGFGLGISYNTLYDFYSVTSKTINSSGLILNEVASVMTEFTKRTLSGQATIGFECLFKNIFSINLGYRYFYGGKIRTNNYLTAADIPESILQTKAATVPPWTGKLTANEFFINLNLFLEF